MKLNEAIKSLYETEDASLTLNEDRKKEIFNFIEQQGELKMRRPRSKAFVAIRNTFSFINYSNLIQATAALLAILILTFSIRHLSTRNQKNYAQNNTPPKETQENGDKNSNNDEYEDVKPVNNEKVPREPNTKTETKDDINTDNQEQETPTIENYDVQDKLTVELLKEKIIGEWVGEATAIDEGISPYTVKLNFAADGNFKSSLIRQAYYLNDPEKRRILAMVTGVPSIGVGNGEICYNVKDMLPDGSGCIELPVFWGNDNWEYTTLNNISFYGNYSRLKFNLLYNGVTYEYDLNNKGIIPPAENDSYKNSVPAENLYVGDYMTIKSMKLSSDLSTLNFELWNDIYGPLKYSLKRKSSTAQTPSNLDNTSENFKKAIVGTWVGTVTTPWLSPYEVEITFNSNGIYSAHSTTEARLLNSDNMSYAPALYYGVDQDSDLKTYSIDYISENNEASGTMAICYKK